MAWLRTSNFALVWNVCEMTLRRFRTSGKRPAPFILTIFRMFYLSPLTQWAVLACCDLLRPEPPVTWLEWNLTLCGRVGAGLHPLSFGLDTHWFHTGAWSSPSHLIFVLGLCCGSVQDVRVSGPELARGFALASPFSRVRHICGNIFHPTLLDSSPQLQWLYRHCKFPRMHLAIIWVSYFG